MKKILPFLALLGGSSALFFSVFPARADVTRVEAETNPTAGDLKILEMPNASSGKAVSIARDWQPMLLAAPPKTGDNFTIWVRYQNDAVLLKSATTEGQKDLQWLWDKPATLTWKKAGRFSRAQIGDNLVIIRGGGGGQGPILDVVVFATDENYDPNADAAPITGAAPLPDDKKGAANITEGAAVALGMQDTPKGTLIEAETHLPGGAAKIVEMMGASGGKAVQSSGDWQPVFQAPLPPGDAFKVWVRHKGGSFAIKTQTGGKGSDRWFWDRPTDWKWSETDVFSREELGGKELVIGRDGGGDKTDSVLVDAVVLAPEIKRALPPNVPDAGAKPEKIAASIDWKQNVGAIPAALWGINEHEIANPDRAGDAKFQTLLGALDTPLIRIHQGNLTNDWTNATTRDWDIVKIKSGFAASRGYGNAPIMLNINRWPGWLSQSETLEPEKVAEFAALCGKLARVMQGEVKQPIAYWELTNELDNSYERAGKLPELWKLYSALAAAIKKENPRAKTGGLAFTWGNYQWLRGFLATKPDVDFLSWHNYATGDLYESNERIMKLAATAFPDIAQSVAKEVQNAGHAPIPLFLTEYNVKYTWDPYERRHQNAVGAVFLASVVHHVAIAGVSGATLWQEKGNAYGSLIGDGNSVFPAYQLFGWGPKFLSGKLALATSGDEKMLEIVPVTRKDGQKAVLLLNKCDHTLILPAASALLPGVKDAQRIDTQGANDKITLETGELTLPGYSLTLLTD